MAVTNRFLLLFCLKLIFGCVLIYASDDDLQSLNLEDPKETIDINILKLLQTHHHNPEYLHQDEEGSDDIQVRHIDGGLYDEKNSKPPKRKRGNLKIKRKKRDVDPDAVRSLRVNPDITPPPNVANQTDNLTPSDLGIDKEVQEIVDLVNKASALALSVARARYCNGSGDGAKKGLRRQSDAAASVAPETTVSPGAPVAPASDLLGIITKVNQYAQSMVAHAISNLTEFCEVSHSIEQYQRARAACPFYDKSRCVQTNFKSTKSGPVKYSTQHRPVIKPSTKHKGAWKEKHFVPLQRAREDNETDAVEAEPAGDVTGVTGDAGVTEAMKVTGAAGARRRRAVEAGSKKAKAETTAEPKEAKAEKKEEPKLEKKEEVKVEKKEAVTPEKKAELKPESKEQPAVKETTEQKEPNQPQPVNKDAANEPKAEKKEEAKEDSKKALRLGTAFPTPKPVDYAPDNRRLSVSSASNFVQTLKDLVSEVISQTANQPSDLLGRGGQVGLALESLFSKDNSKEKETEKKKQKIVKKLKHQRVDGKHLIKKKVVGLNIEPEPLRISENERKEMIKDIFDTEQDLQNVKLEDLEKTLVTRKRRLRNHDTEKKKVKSHNRHEVKKLVSANSFPQQPSLQAPDQEANDPEVQEVPEGETAPESIEIETEFIPRTIELTKKNKAFYDDRKWPDGYVYYMLKTDTPYDLNDVRRRLKAVNDILRAKTCVQLQEIRPGEANKYEDYLVLDTSPDYVTGRVGGRQPFGVVELFEGGQHIQHAAMVAMAMLGFYFEVSRHDRDKFIRVHQRHVRPDKLHHFEKIRSDASLHLPYDFKSASHPAWQFWRHIGRTGISTVATLKEKDPDGSVMKSLGQHKQLLSEIDLVKINSVYGTKCFKMARRYRES